MFQDKAGEIWQITPVTDMDLSASIKANKVLSRGAIESEGSEVSEEEESDEEEEEDDEDDYGTEPQAISD